MAQIRWTLQAADDLEAITEFIAADSPHYAQLFAIDVLNASPRQRLYPFLITWPVIEVSISGFSARGMKLLSGFALNCRTRPLSVRGNAARLRSDVLPENWTR